MSFELRAPDNILQLKVELLAANIEGQKSSLMFPWRWSNSGLSPNEIYTCPILYLCTLCFCGNRLDSINSFPGASSGPNFPVRNWGWCSPPLRSQMCVNPVHYSIRRMGVSPASNSQRTRDDQIQN
jgi:hypothetical protein